MEPASTSELLLHLPLAKELYEGVAASLPIIDYYTRIPEGASYLEEGVGHCWIFRNALRDDTIRTLGISKTEASDHHTHLDLLNQAMPFFTGTSKAHMIELSMHHIWGIDELGQLDPNMFGVDMQDAFTTSKWLEKLKVEVLGIDHEIMDQLLLQEPSQPVFHPGELFLVDDPVRYNKALEMLVLSANSPMEHYLDLLNALQVQIDAFHEKGCRLAHHRLELMYSEDFSTEAVNFVFHKIRLGHQLLPEEKAQLRSSMLFHLSEMYHEKGWKQQFHLGTIRQLKGKNTGFDAKGDDETAWYVLRFLHRMNDANLLTDTILHHPHKPGLLARIADKFNRSSTDFRITVRSSWESITHPDQFISQWQAMSFPALQRQMMAPPSEARLYSDILYHDYFRRIMCNYVASEVERGLMPNHSDHLEGWIRRVCYENAQDFWKH